MISKWWPGNERFYRRVQPDEQWSYSPRINFSYAGPSRDRINPTIWRISGPGLSTPGLNSSVLWPYAPTFDEPTLTHERLRQLAMPKLSFYSPYHGAGGYTTNTDQVQSS